MIPFGKLWPINGKLDNGQNSGMGMPRNVLLKLLKINKPENAEC